jgi:hypothetical protein
MQSCAGLQVIGLLAFATAMASLRVGMVGGLYLLMAFTLLLAPAATASNSSHIPPRAQSAAMICEAALAAVCTMHIAAAYVLTAELLPLHKRTCSFVQSFWGLQCGPDSRGCLASLVVPFALLAGIALTRHASNHR